MGLFCGSSRRWAASVFRSSWARSLRRSLPDFMTPYRIAAPRMQVPKNIIQRAVTEVSPRSIPTPLFPIFALAVVSTSQTRVEAHVPILRTRVWSSNSSRPGKELRDRGQLRSRQAGGYGRDCKRMGELEPGRRSCATVSALELRPFHCISPAAKELTDGWTFRRGNQDACMQTVGRGRQAGWRDGAFLVRS